MRKKLKLSIPNWSKVVSGLFFLLLLGAYTQIFAIASPYEPGATLDPECAPGEVNCTVNIGGGTSPLSIVNSSNLFSTGLTGTGNGVTTTTGAIFLGTDAGNLATGANRANFIGEEAGNGATSASTSNFIGRRAGYGATDASSSNFIGTLAGEGATNAYDSIFIGSYSGEGATNADTANFIGRSAGNYALNALQSNFIGFNAGNTAENSNDSNFLGTSAGSGALNASNSIFIGTYAGEDDTVNNTTSLHDWSILLGYNTKTGGYKNSVLIGGATNSTPISNTKTNQFMLAPSLTEMRLRGVDYTLPSSQGGVSTVLTNNGSGVLSWEAASSSGGPWTESGSDIYFTGGKVGIGTDTPNGTLSVKGSLTTQGAELITNGTFTGNANGWNLYDTGAYNNNEVTVTYTGSETEAGISTAVTLESGKKYVLTFTLSNVNNDEVYLYFDNDSFNNNTTYTNGTHNVLITVDNTGIDNIYFENWNWNSNSSWTIDNVSLKELDTIYPGLEVLSPEGKRIFAVAGDDETNFLYGQNAGSNLLKAFDSILMGRLSGSDSSNLRDAIFLGRNSGTGVVNSSSIIALGYNSAKSISNSYSSFFVGSGSGYLSSNLTAIVAIGIDAGAQSSLSNSSVFIGPSAGKNAPNSNASVFLGISAGENSSNVSNSNFIGPSSGYNSSASSSNFFGINSGNSATNASSSNFFGDASGGYATNAYNSNFFGPYAGWMATNAANSIFIGKNAGSGDTVNNTAAYDDFSTFANTSILIGHLTNTGGFSNSIAIGAYAANTATNQFMIGSVRRPIDTTRWNGSSSTQCTLTTGTGIACTSDENLKTNINDLQSTTLEKLLNVRTVTFNWKEGNSDKLNIGFLAQDLEKYFPELVATDKDGLKSVYYANMTPILTEAIRELNLKVENLENESQNWFSNLISNVTEFVAGIIRAKDKLCIGEGSEEVCITKEELLDIKKNAGLYHEPVVEEPVFEEPIAEEELAEEGSEIEEKPAVEETLKEQVVPVVPEVVEPEPIVEEEKEPEIPIEEKGNEPEIPEEVQVVA